MEIDSNEDYIEEYIQDKYKVMVPVLEIETNKPNMKWENEDLKEFFSKFGNINRIEISTNIAIIVFDSFLDALVTYEHVSSLNEKKEFEISWYNDKDEIILSILGRNKLKKPTNGEIIENINSTMLNRQNPIKHTTQIIDDDANSFIPSSFNKNKNDENFYTNTFAQYNFYSDFCLTPKSRKLFMNLMQNNQKKIDSFFHYGTEIKDTTERVVPSGKLSCKFYIQIENDPDFQICKRIIGADGINIKRIIDFTSKGGNGTYIMDSVKIRLRGKGSGYKEGPYNRESDEMLNLCVSSKYVDKYRKACSLVQELLINIYEEYKRFCERSGKVPNNNLTIQKIENIATKK